jgi:hypothetical protein
MVYKQSEDRIFDIEDQPDGEEKFFYIVYRYRLFIGSWIGFMLLIIPVYLSITLSLILL